MISDNDLLRMALEAAESAYAPYSGFRVGAAVLMEDGTVVTGSNQENIAYPEGLCAERVALNYAKHLHPNLEVEVVAIASHDSDSGITPCGACRQVMAEVVRRQHGCDMRVLMASDATGEDFVESSVSDLLPLSFNF